MYSSSYLSVLIEELSSNGFAEFCKMLDVRGHRWLLSNSDPHNTDPKDDFFDDLFCAFDIHRVFASRAINSKADGRGKISELAIRNYKE